jgi:hypothetical protein
LKTIVHHTCLQDNGEEFVIANAPFLSTYVNEENINKPFLGEGFYFWEYDLDMAIYWGEKHYKQTSYYVIEAEIECEDEFFFDLVGNVFHLEHLRNLIVLAKQLFPQKANNLDLSTLIELLKDLHNNDPRYSGMFPFKIIRSLNNPINHKEYITYNKFKNWNKLLIKPVYMLCVIEKKYISLHSKKIAYKFSNN